MRRSAASIITASILSCAVATAADGGGIPGEESSAVSEVVKGADAPPDGSLSGGPFRLDPLLPGGGGISASAQLLLFGSTGQPTVTPSSGTRLTVRPGFWTPVDVTATHRIFSNGFE